MDPKAALSQKKSDILEQYQKFKMEGKKLKEIQKMYTSVIQSCTVENITAEAIFKEWTLKNKNIKNQLNIIECHRNQLKETTKQDKNLIKVAEQQNVELRRKQVMAEYIFETEEAINKQKLCLLKNT